MPKLTTPDSWLIIDRDHFYIGLSTLWVEGWSRQLGRRMDGSKGKYYMKPIKLAELSQNTWPVRNEQVMNVNESQNIFKKDPPLRTTQKRWRGRGGGGGLLTKRTSERYTVPNTTAQVWVPGRGPKRWEGTGSDLATTLGAAPSRGRQRLKPAFNKTDGGMTDLGIVAPCPESFKKPEVCRIKSIWGQYKQCHGWKDSEPEGRIKSINSWR